MMDDYKLLFKKMNCPNKHLKKRMSKKEEMAKTIKLFTKREEKNGQRLWMKLRVQSSRKNQNPGFTQQLWSRERSFEKL